MGESEGQHQEGESEGQHQGEEANTTASKNSSSRALVVMAVTNNQDEDVEDKQQVVSSQDMEESSNGEQFGNGVERPASSASNIMAWTEDSLPTSCQKLQADESNIAGAMGEQPKEDQHADKATTTSNTISAVVIVNNQAKDEEKMIQQVVNHEPPPKEEAEGQTKPKAVDLTLSATSTSSATTRQGRRPRHQRNTKAAANKLAELELKNSATNNSASTTSHVEADHNQNMPAAEELTSSSVTSTSSAASRPAITSNSIMLESSSTSQAATQSVEITVEEETKESEDHMPGSSRPALEQSMVHKPSPQSFLNTSSITAQQSPQPAPYDRAAASTCRSRPCDKKAVRPHGGSGGSVGYPLPSLELTPGAVSAPGRAFGALRRQDPQPSTSTPSRSSVPPPEHRSSLLGRLFSTRTSITTPTMQDECSSSVSYGDGVAVTAKAVDNAELVFDAQDVEVDNSTRNTRLLVYCSVIGVMVVIVAVSLGVLLKNGDDIPPIDDGGDPRCKLGAGKFNVVVNCKCRNTTELYTATLSDEEITLYHELMAEEDFRPPDAAAESDTKMSSCSSHNQAVLDMTSFNRKGLNASIVDKARREDHFDGVLQLYGITLFYVQMDGDRWENKENWLETYNFCQWFGVTCTSTARISSLVLPSNGLAGTLPNALHLLSHLFELDLSQNKGIYGPLPAKFLSNAEKLHVLRLENLQLSGTIPEDVSHLTRLSVLALHNNALTGTIPRGLGEMELTYFDFSDNKLTGSIPTELGNQVKIHSFNLAANMLTGTLPSEMGRLSVLELLELSKNKFHGALPSFLGTLPRLDTTLISKSGFSGPIPDTFCERDLSATIIQANCEHRDGNEADGIIPSCSCCNRQNRSLIWCEEDSGGWEFPSS